MKKTIVRLHLNGFIFTPKLIPTLGFIIVLPCLIKLGFWQLHRAAFKNQLHVKYEARLNHQPITTLKSIGELSTLDYMPVKLPGYYDHQHSIYVDNKIVNHHAGYYVLTPFILKSNPQKVVLVNRGWIPRLKDRRHLPSIKPIQGLQIASGIIKLPSERYLVLARDKGPIKWPLLVQAINLKQLTNALKKPIYPFTILLSPKAANGFVRKWNPVTLSASRHIGYAVQWFALALTLVIIFIVVNTKRANDGKNQPKNQS